MADVRSELDRDMSTERRLRLGFGMGEGKRLVMFRRHGFCATRYRVLGVTGEGFVKLEGCAGEYLPEVLQKVG
jgi:hypothetical protein